MHRKNIYVIGDGPAGSATALSLAKRLSSETNTNRDFSIVQVSATTKAGHYIGETVPPAANEYLQELGLGGCLNDQDHVLCPGSISVWGDDKPGYNDFFYTPVGNGFHLNRKLFNQQLYGAAHAAGVTQLGDTKLTGVVEEKAGLQLQLFDQKSKKTSTVAADFIVDATGIRASAARSLNVARNQFDSVISVGAVFSLPEPSSKPAYTLVSASEYGWWYGTQLPNQNALISFCTDSQNLKELKLTKPEIWHAMLEQNSWFYKQCVQQFGTPIPQPEELFKRAAPSAILSNVAGQRWLAVGDAAASYDSMTSAGITKALQQGILASKAISKCLLQQDALACKQYAQSVFADFNQYLQLHQQFYSSEQRFATSGFWRRRQLH